MSLSPQAIDPVPEQTKAVAQAAFPNGNTYIRKGWLSQIPQRSER